MLRSGLCLSLRSLENTLRTFLKVDLVWLVRYGLGLLAFWALRVSSAIELLEFVRLQIILAYLGLGCLLDQQLLEFFVVYGHGLVELGIP